MQVASSVRDGVQRSGSEKVVIVQSGKIRAYGKEMCKFVFVVLVGGQVLLDDGERKSFGKFLRFAPCQSVYPQHGPDGVICSALQPRVYLPGGVETRLESRKNCVVWWFDVGSVLKPSNCASKSDSGIDCLQVGDAPEDP